MNDAFKDLTNQERNNITQEAQVNKKQNYFIFQFCVQFGLRLMSFEQLAKWFEQSPIPPLMVLLPKRSYSSEADNQSKKCCHFYLKMNLFLVPAKRQCTEFE